MLLLQDDRPCEAGTSLGQRLHRFDVLPRDRCARRVFDTFGRRRAVVSLGRERCARGRIDPRRRRLRVLSLRHHAEETLLARLSSQRILLFLPAGLPRRLALVGREKRKRPPIEQFSRSSRFGEPVGGRDLVSCKLLPFSRREICRNDVRNEILAVEVRYVLTAVPNENLAEFSQSYRFCVAVDL